MLYLTTWLLAYLSITNGNKGKLPASSLKRISRMLLPAFLKHNNEHFLQTAKQEQITVALTNSFWPCTSITFMSEKHIIWKHLTICNETTLLIMLIKVSCLQTLKHHGPMPENIAASWWLDWKMCPTLSSASGIITKTQLQLWFCLFTSSLNPSQSIVSIV